MNDNAKVIAVTGASRGIGSAIVEELAARGHIVGCLSRKGAGPEDRQVDGSLFHYRCDMDDDQSITAAIDGLAKAAGRLDGLVNNAGLHLEGRSEEFPTDQFEASLRTNVTGVFVACRQAHPHLLAAGGGLIINIGSFFDSLGAQRTAAYCASKAAVAALTRCLAVEWAKQKIRVIDVAPGFIATELNKDYMEHDSFNKFLRQRIPVGAPGSPEEIGRLIAMLYDTDLPFLTGETITIDGGQSVNQ
jgi:NAD(P)-dependent dehydrogenase (short-subunit alcohol dehydrogenase family)